MALSVIDLLQGINRKQAGRRPIMLVKSPRFERYPAALMHAYRGPGVMAIGRFIERGHAALRALAFHTKLKR